MKYKKIILISTGLLLFSTITPTVLPVIGGQTAHAEEFLKNGKAYVEKGVTTVDMVTEDGIVYPAGTSVARGSRQNGVATSDYYLYFTVEAFFFMGAGPIPAEYAKIVSSEIVTVHSEGMTIADNPVPQSAIKTPLKPYLPNQIQVDKTELNNLLNQAEQAINSNIYTDNSVSTLKINLNKGYTIRDNTKVSQQELDSIVLELKSALANLKEKPIMTNKKDLLDTINKAKSANDNPSNYTVETYVPFKKAYDNAMKIYNKDNAPQYDIDDAEGALRFYMTKLIKNGNIESNQLNKINLQKALEKANDIKDLSVYTTTSVSTFNSTKNKAETVNKNSNASQVEIDLATKNLVEAIEGLTKDTTNPVTVDKTYLQNALTKANEVTDLSLYTENSVLIFTAAKEKAERINHDIETTQEIVNDTTNSLLNAIEGLTKTIVAPIKVDKTELKNTLNKANDIKNLSDYTASSIAVFNTAKESAERISLSTNVTQVEVDEATRTLKNAISGLTEITETPMAIDKTHLQNALAKANNIENLTSYNQNSIVIFKLAKEKAEKVNIDMNATQEEINEATSSLLESIQGLTKKIPSQITKDDTTNKEKDHINKQALTSNKKNITKKQINTTNNKQLPKTNDTLNSKLIGFAGSLSIILSGLLIFKRKQ